MRFRTENSPAPGDLIKLQGFLNTWSDELDIEDFSSVKVTEYWLRDAGLWPGKAPLSATACSEVLELRKLLRDWVRQRQVPARLVSQAASLTYRLDWASVATYVPTGQGLSFLRGELIATALRAHDAGTWERIKCCGLASCGWCYYDSTRSRTRHWCSMKTCGSRAKARAYYQRKTAQR